MKLVFARPLRFSNLLQPPKLQHGGNLALFGVHY